MAPLTIPWRRDGRDLIGAGFRVVKVGRQYELWRDGELVGRFIERGVALNVAEREWVKRDG